MVVPNQKKENLIPIIRERIARGSIIISDCWKAYNELSECGYIHLTVNHSQNFIDRQDRFIHTQKIENFWRWAKNRFLSTTKNTEKRLSKISEHLFRKNSKSVFQTLFIILDIVAFGSSVILLITLMIPMMFVIITHPLPDLDSAFFGPFNWYHDRTIKWYKSVTGIFLDLLLT
ncbi:hypothetical protein RF11_06958 [Thelohanellus kitauei]|uniref:ISXO2-like transposase domain-containing protein n=1 Tax=Thelohanellus kitauei TaxID=669202 RepID=A0A0C2MC69_THEKT|nr:hypothetical protein RF11_06958 [Thelohanellus kitauei]